MPRRNDISKILIIGSGPIVIGQLAEFDYSSTQVCKALNAEGYEVGQLLNKDTFELPCGWGKSLSYL